MLRLRLVTIVGCASALWSVGPSSAAAAPPSASGAQRQIAEQCSRRTQPGVLASRFAVRELRAARRTLRARSLQFTRCWTAVESQLAWHTARRGRPGALIDDCLRHHGALTHRYSASVLARALATASPELRTETHCASGIASQLNAARRGKPVARVKLSPRSSAQPLTGDALLARYAILRRPARDDDRPSDAMAAAYRQAIRDGAASVDGARLVRGLRGMTMFVVASRASGLCLLMDFTATTPGFSVICQGGGFEAPAGIVRVPGGVMVIAALLDGAMAPEVVDPWGRWRAAPATDGVVTKLFSRPPRLFRVTGSDGAVHYGDLNFSW